MHVLSPSAHAEARRITLLRGGLVATVALFGGCAGGHVDHTARRSTRIPVADASVVDLNVGAGYLRVQGDPSASDVSVRGVAHATSAQALALIRFSARRSNDTIFVSCIIPGSGASKVPTAGMDVTIELPSRLAMTVIDSAGESVFRNVAALRVIHGDGALDVDSVAGNVDVSDGAGDMVIADVRGDVSIVDGPGSIAVSNVGGSVHIPTDGSGEIQLSDVTGNVAVSKKESGEVLVRNVGGDMSVTANGSGSIEYHNVRGRVIVANAERH